MKKKATIIICSSLVVLLALFSACSKEFGLSKNTEIPTGTSDKPTEQLISELEAKISALLQNQQLSEATSKKEIEKLRAEIEALKSEKSTDTPTERPTEESESEFKYTVLNGLACITEINTNKENIVIPYTIDGYKVRSIASEVIDSKSVKSIVISVGIEEIDWFAFKNCTSLISVTIPDTVNSIGYGAFDNVSNGFVIRCSRDSFAHRYAQSYGITYDIS